MIQELGLYVQAVKLISDTFDLDFVDGIDFVNALGAIVEAVSEEEDFDGDKLLELGTALIEEYGTERGSQIIGFMMADEEVWADIGAIALSLRNELNGFDELATMVMNYIK